MDLSNLIDKYGNTPLMLACNMRDGNEKQKDYVVHLLESGVDPNQRNIYGETALTLCIQNDLFDIYDLLVSHGADPNLPVPFKEYGYGEAYLHEEFGEIVIKSTSALCEMVSRITWMIEEIIDSDSFELTDEQIQMRLTKCRKYVELAKKLIKERADMEQVNRYGTKILDSLRYHKHPIVWDLIIYCLENGASIKDYKYHSGHLMHGAILSGNINLVNYLLEEKGVSIKVVKSYYNKYVYGMALKKQILSEYERRCERITKSTLLPKKKYFYRKTKTESIDDKKIWKNYVILPVLEIIAEKSVLPPEIILREIGKWVFI